MAISIQAPISTITFQGNGVTVLSQSTDAVEYVYFNAGFEVPTATQDATESVYFNVGFESPTKTKDTTEYVYFNVEEVLPYDTLHMRVRYRVVDLADLTDVNFDDYVPSNNDVLTYNSGLQQWLPMEPQGSGGGGDHDSIDHSVVMQSVSLAEIGDVSVGGASSGDVLTWDGSEWVPNAAGGGGGGGVSDHGLLNGLNDDDHPIYLTTGRHDNVDHYDVVSVLSVDTLSDVSTASAASGQYLWFDGTNWIPKTLVGGGGGASEHHELGGLEDDDHLQYLTEDRHDGHDHTVAMQSVELSDISNVNASGAVTGEVLKYDGAEWVPGEAGIGEHTHDYMSVTGGGISVAREDTVAGSVTVNLADGNDHFLTVSGEVTDTTISGWTAGKMCAVTVQFMQDGTGNHSIAMPTGVTWIGGEEPAALADPNTITTVMFWSIDGGTTVYGAAAGAGGSGGGDILVKDTIASNYVVDLTAGTFFDLTVSGGVTLSLAGAVVDEVSAATVLVRQDGTGGYDVTWPNVTWLPGAEPSESQGPNESTMVLFWSTDGGINWYGSYGVSASDFLSTTGGGKSVYRAETVAGSVTVDLTEGNDHLLTVSGEITDTTLTGFTDGKMCSVVVQYIQDGTGGHAIAIPSGVTWISGEAPTPLTDPDTISHMVFWSIDGGTTIYGAAAGAGGTLGAAADIGDGTSATILYEHGLATQDVIVAVYDTSGSAPVQVFPDSVEATDLNTVTLTFATAPPLESRRIVVVGL